MQRSPLKERPNRDDAQILSDLQHAVAVRVSAYTGVRLGELLALRWSDVDSSGFALTITAAFNSTAPAALPEAHSAQHQ